MKEAKTDIEEQVPFLFFSKSLTDIQNVHKVSLQFQKIYHKGK
jgi:hypothetical protein